VAAPDRTALRFFDAADKARAVLGIVEKESSPGLVLNDGAGTARAILMLTSEGPGMDFFDKNKNPDLDGALSRSAVAKDVRKPRRRQGGTPWVFRRECTRWCWFHPGRRSRRWNWRFRLRGRRRF